MQTQTNIVSRLLGLGLAALTIAGAQAQTVPVAQIYRARTIVPAINGNAGHVAANNAGDVFYDSQGDNVTYWVKRGTTTPIPLVTGLSGGRSVFVDASNNVFAPSNYGGTIIEVPYVNGTYQTNNAAGSLPACTTTTPTAPCTQFGSGGATTSYYYQPDDLGTDGASDFYVIDEYDQTATGGSGKFTGILKFVPNGSTYNATYITTSLPHLNNNNAQIAVDKYGNVYYADIDNLKLYYLPIGTGVALNSTTDKRTAIQITNAAITSPTGVTVDKAGNLFVTNSNTPYAILEYPASTLPSPTQQGTPFSAAPIVFDPTYSANSVGFDGLGDMFYTGYSGSATNLNEATFNAFNLGSAAIGTPVSTTAITLNVQFNTATTLSGIALSGNPAFSYIPGTCAAITYAAGGSCNINVNYTPTQVGLQEAAIVFSSGGSQVFSALLAGTGLGALQTNDPATVTAIGSGLSSPQGIAVDSAKNAYVADSGLNAVMRYAPGATTGTAIGSGLSKPTAVALDNAGDLYIADSGNGRVVEVPNVAGTLTTSAQTTIVSGLGSTLGLAIDPYGNLYVADTANDQVLQLAAVNGIPSTSAQSVVMNKTLFAYSVAPYALATDSTGNLFIADVTANTITEITYYGKQNSTIGSGYSHPNGLATDASGSLYVADPGNFRLLKIPYEAPIFNTNDQYSVGPAFSVTLGISVPFAVATDSLANLYVVDNYNKRAELLNRQQGTLNLGASNVGNATAQQNVNVANAGNQALTLGNPDYATTPNPAFAITSPTGNGCANSETLAPSITCVLQVVFTPTAATAYSQTLTFTDNASNSPTTETLAGTGANLSPDTLTLAQVGGNVAFGQTLQVSATISSATAGTPTGDIIFSVDGSFNQVVAVTGKTVTASFAGLTAGPHTIAASYTGDTTFAPSTQTLAVVLTRAQVAIALVGTAAGTYPVSGPAGSSFTFNVNITPSTSTIPTGSVTFTLGSQTLGVVTGLTKVSTGVYGVTFSTNQITSSGTVVASYSGDVNYLPATATVPVVVSAATFTLTPSTLSVTMGRAAVATTSLQVLSLSGFGSSAIDLYCTGLPANTTCAFDPNGFQVLASNQLYPSGNAAVPVTLTITTGNTPPVPQPPVGGLSHRTLAALRGWHLGLPALALLPFALLLRPRRSRKVRAGLTMLSLLLLLLGGTTLTGCGSNLVGNTPAGTYNVTITANGITTVASGTGATVTQTAQLTLVVQ